MAVARMKARIEMKTGFQNKPILEDLYERLEKESPGQGILMAKEKPIIDELVTRLRNREMERNNSFSSFGSPQDSISNSSIANSLFPLESLLQDDNNLTKFRDFIQEKGESDMIEFWIACVECHKTTLGTTSLAKKIVNKLFKEGDLGHGKLDEDKLQLALHSAVVAVRYELLLHKETVHQQALGLVDEYVRDIAPRRIPLSHDLQTSLIDSVENSNVPEEELIRVVMAAQHEVIEILQDKYLTEFEELL